MDDAVQAITMAFAVLVFVIALSLAMLLIKQATNTSELLVQYSDLTAFYDNIQLDNNNGITETERVVGLDTVIPTLYRYYKENFCVKIYDVDGSKLLQIFDVNIETNLRSAIINTNASSTSNDPSLIRDDALKKVYNDDTTLYCLFGAPWLGSTETIKQRIDFFIHGDAGYINNSYVDYSSNDGFAAKVDENTKFKERFISYSYSGSTVTTDEGETLVNGAKSKDKIVIIYTILSNSGEAEGETTP